MKKTIIVDTNAANLHSVFKAFKFIGANVEISKDIKEIENADLIILPGVGAFGAVMESINKNNLSEIIKKSVDEKKPFLGICVGLQILFGESEESKDISGLKIFQGKVIKFKKAKKVPHVGWNDVNGKKFYFVHSYYVKPDDKSIIFAETEYDGEKFTSIIKKDNLLAVQFHPEKSGDEGISFLSDFVRGKL